MKRFHIAIATHNIEATVTDYSRRLGAEPCVVVPGEYALWRTDNLNFSVRQVPQGQSGELRHLGWEEDTAAAFTSDVDCNGILWESFAAHHQAAEITELWPDAEQPPAAS